MAGLNRAADNGDALEGCAEAAVAAFAVWTLYCNALVYTGQDFDALSRFSFVPLLAMGILFSLRSRAARLRLVSPDQSWPDAAARVPLSAALVLIAAAVASHAAGSYLGYWLGAVAVLGFICIWGAKPPAALATDLQAETPRRVRLETAAVLALALLAAAVTTVSHRPDGDDSAYVSVIVHALDFPSEPLLRYDGIHGVSDLPLVFTNYRAHSHELLSAVLARWSGEEPLQVYHVLLPPLMAMLMVLGNWLLLRQLAPRLALAGLAFTLIALIAWGDSFRSPGNFAFVRLFQGKAVFASAVIPLILFFALRFARERDLRSWAALCFAQVTAMGFTATAVAVAPISAGLVLLASSRPDAPSVRILFAGLAASIHPIVVGAIVAYESTGATGLAVSGHPASFSILVQEIDIQRDLAAVFGVNARASIALACLPIVPFFVSGRAQSRTIALLLLLFYAVVFNPWTASWLIRLLAEQSITLHTWRFLWILPAPLLVGLCVAGLCRSIPLANTLPRMALCLALAATLYLSLPGTRAVSRANGVRFGTPGYKVGVNWRIAARIHELTPIRGRVLAPENVAQWLSTLRVHPYPEVARIMYVAALQESFGREEVVTRIKLHRFITGKKGQRMALAEVMTLLRKRQIETVAFSHRLPEAKSFAQALHAAGYASEVAGGYQLWTPAR